MKPDHYWVTIPYDNKYDYMGNPVAYLWPIYLDQHTLFFRKKYDVVQGTVIDWFKQRCRDDTHMFGHVWTFPRNYQHLYKQYPGGIPIHRKQHAAREFGIIVWFRSLDDAILCKLAADDGTFG